MPKMTEPTNAARAAFNAWCASASLEQDYWRRQQRWESFLAGWIASQAPRCDAAATADPDRRRGILLTQTERLPTR